MSVAHIKEEILQLTSADRREVEVFLHDLAQKEQEPVNDAAQRGRKMSHDEAMDYVFTEFAPVLSRLAQ